MRSVISRFTPVVSAVVYVTAGDGITHSVTGAGAPYSVIGAGATLDQCCWRSENGWS